MSDPIKLIIFDVDGTLVDSQADIIAAMTEAFKGLGQPVPNRNAILSIVGLSLDHAMAQLAPELTRRDHDLLVEGYKDSYVALRAKIGAAQSSPLYPGAREVLDALKAQENVLLGVATGKSRRGLDKLIEAHDLGAYFVTQQVSDFHPSKPHPSMILSALNETGVEAKHAVMIGDTSFDMDMAQAAGVTGIGVSWGYHNIHRLGAARCVVDHFDDLPGVIAQIWQGAET